MIGTVHITTIYVLSDTLIADYYNRTETNLKALKNLIFREFITKNFPKTQSYPQVT